MRRWLLGIVLLLAFCEAAQAQDLGAGTGATTSAAGAESAAGAATAGAGEPRNIWSRLHRTPEQRIKARARFCNSPAGKLVNALLLPVSGLTGGLIQPLCKPAQASAANLKKPADSAQGAAARIKAEEAEAKAKIADIEFLATKNCKRYPEAEAALINGLRAEKSECVRLAAAKALARGCCCTPKVIKALTMSVNESTKDSFPAEESERVRLMAYLALERCMQACQPTANEEPPEKPTEKKEDEKKSVAFIADGAVLRATYYTSTFQQVPEAEVFHDARRTLARGMRVSSETMQSLQGQTSLREMLQPTGPSTEPRTLIPINRIAAPETTPRTPRSLMGIVQNAFSGQ